MNKYIVAPMQPGEEETAIALLEQELYAKGRGERHFHWFYQQRNNLLVFLKDAETGEVVGCAGSGFYPFSIDGVTRVGSINVDLFVKKDHRSPAAVWVLHQEVTKLGLQRADFCYGNPNDKATPLFRVAKLFTSVSPFQRYISVLDAKELIGTILKDNFVGRCAVKCLTILLWVKHHASNFLFSSGKVTNVFDLTGSELKEISNFIWSQEVTVKSERPAEFIQWRYIESPEQEYKFFTYRLNGEAGCVVYYLLLNRAYIVDLIYNVGNKSLLTRMLTAFNTYCYNERISMAVLEAIVDAKFSRLLIRSFFIRFTDHAKVLWVHSNDIFIKGRLLNTDGYLWLSGNEDVN